MTLQEYQRRREEAEKRIAAFIAKELKSFRNDTGEAIRDVEVLLGHGVVSGGKVVEWVVENVSCETTVR